MKNLEKFDAIDTQFAIAVENLQRAFSEEMLNVIPFNEDNEFLFEKDGNVDYNELPDIILGDGTRDRFAGFCKDSEGTIRGARIPMSRKKSALYPCEILLGSWTIGWIAGSSNRKCVPYLMGYGTFSKSLARKLIV